MPSKSSVTSQSVKRYYDNNTRFFISLGTGKKNHSIHRAVWGEEVQNLEDAQAFAHKLIHDVLVKAAFPQHFHVLDLGCGVGSTLFYLAKIFEEKASYTGISISSKQIEIAKKINQKYNLSCHFEAADFLQLPKMPPVHAAYAIEAFIHASDAQVFFKEVGRILHTGGRLILIDDFLTKKGNTSDLPSLHRKWLSAVEKGWMAGSLITPVQAAKLAKESGLHLTENNDLTPYLELRRPRDRFIEVLVKCFGSWVNHSTYLRSLWGGDALQKCLLNGLLEYRILIFEKKQ